MYELTIASLFIVFFSISDNYVGEIMGCKTRQLFMNNMLFKHLSLLCFIYFAVNLTNERSEHPLKTLKKTILLWMVYIIFIRMSTVYLGISISLLMIYFIIEQYKNYLKENKNSEYTSHLDTLDLINNIIEKIIFIPIMIGFYQYYKSEKKILGKQFDLYNFILGHKKCR